MIYYEEKQVTFNNLEPTTNLEIRKNDDELISQLFFLQLMTNRSGSLWLFGLRSMCESGISSWLGRKSNYSNTKDLEDISICKYSEGGFRFAVKRGNSG